MKKYLIIILTAVVTLTSCEDFLTKSNPNKIESETYFTNESSLKIYTNGLGRSFATLILAFCEGDIGTDIMFQNGTNLYYTDTYTAEDASNWKTSNWSQLRNVNYFLDNMRSAPASEEILNHYEGVGRFYRAMFYFAKVQTFGAVPWYDHLVDSQNPDDIYAPRTNREVVCKHILDDLNFACEHCLATKEFMDRAGYVNKYVALALKSRFCLYEGSFRTYHNVDPSTGLAWQKDDAAMYLNECIAASEAIIGSDLFSLTDSPSNRRTQYRDMFTCEDACSTYLNEIIWARDYDLGLNVTNNIDKKYFTPRFTSGTGCGFTRQFINTYLMTDGTPFTTKYPDNEHVDFATECKDRDYRLAQTIRTPGFTRDHGTNPCAPDVQFSMSGYQPVKWTLDDSSKDPHTSASATDVPLMRYAEVLLNYAEAKAILGQCDKAVWDKTIGALRIRSGVKNIYPILADPYMVDYFQGRVTDPVVLEVRRERGIELAMENLRFDDLMRWHQGELLVRERQGIYIPTTETGIDLNGDGVPETYVSATVTEKPGFRVLGIDNASKDLGNRLKEGTKGIIITGKLVTDTWSWKDYKYVRPIPTEAILENRNLEQNPGW